MYQTINFKATNCRVYLRQSRNLLCAFLLAGAASTAIAQFVPTKESLSGLYAGKAYSPYAERSFPDRVFWGDTHLHTGLSMDAGLFGARLGLDDAYRFARGEEVIASSGQPARLGRPLDWLVIADHSDGIGLFGDIAAGKPELMAYEQSAGWIKGFEKGGDAAVQASLDLITAFSNNKMDPEMFKLYSPGSKPFKNLGERGIQLGCCELRQ